MIAYAENTRLALAAETAWGEPPASGFGNLHINAESLMPQVRSLQPYPLTAVLPRIRLEELIAGDIEAPLAAATLERLLPLILLGEDVAHQMDIVTTQTADSNGAFAVPAAHRSVFVEADQIWVSSPDSGIAGFFPIVLVAGVPHLSGFENGQQIISPACALRRLTAGHDIQSASIIRKYDETGAWKRLNGMMAQRLVIDLEEDRPPVLTASMIGKSQDSLETEPVFTETLPPEPFDLSRNLAVLAFTDSQTGQRVDTATMVMTGLRLVLERTGMVPQFGLGGVTPQMILPGRLQVSGSLSVLVSGQHFFDWLEHRNPIALTLQLASSRSGFSLSLPQIEINGVDGGASNTDQPVRAVFHFTDSLADGQSPVRFFTHS